MKKAFKKKVAKKKVARIRLSSDVYREIDRRFDFVDDLVPTQTENCIKVRSMTKQLAKTISRLTPICREQSLAITKLEEALHFAIAAIVRPKGDS